MNSDRRAEPLGNPASALLMRESLFFSRNMVQEVSRGKAKVLE
jgi:hypothetical protein